MCSPDTAIREAARRMHQQGVGSIVIAGEDAIPRGIFTLRDLRRIVADPRISPEGPIASVMANNPRRAARRCHGV
ncbi:MAG: CBS domain-containing protein [Hahellaceae bacterium]|nr:CBS domain-containing protein [Hahellaceae bacterium]